MSRVGFAISGYSLAYNYKMRLENTYQRALSGLSSNVSSMDATLQKSRYASTPVMLAVLSAGIWRDASAAKADLSMLPVTEI